MKELFFIVGAQRSGTTYLVNFLDAHSEIEFAKPMVPEPKFFLSESEFRKGKEYYLSKFFPHHKGKIIGEKSTSYLESPLAGKRIKQMFPLSKVIILLRNPVYRAISNYFFSKLNGIETRSLREVFIEKKTLEVDLNKFSVSPIDYLKRGEYMTSLDAYREIFGKDSMKILLFERMIDNKTYLNSVLEFLNVSPVSTLPENLDKNSSTYTEKIDEDVLKELKKYFNHSIDELSKKYRLDLSVWKN